MNILKDIESCKNKALRQAIQQKIDAKTKPLGALGVLETIALQIGSIQQTTTPEILKPTILVFAADHGIAKKGIVNPFPQEVTAQMVYNFLDGGAAINIFSKTNGIDLKIIDAGVNHEFAEHPLLIDRKIAPGTKNYQVAPAMTISQCQQALQYGSALIEDLYNEGCNSVGFGEMGIGNTSSAALLMHYFTQIPMEDCVGSGTGLKYEGVQKKQDILTTVYEKHQPKSPIAALAAFGGFEIAMLCGAIHRAAVLQMTVVIDGFIVSAALLSVQAIHPEVLEYCIFSHVSGEKGHQKILDFLHAKPLLDMKLCLGEGTGAALAFPMLRCAVNFLNQMASFESAGVSGKL